jgi:hypothetical protein
VSKVARWLGLNAQASPGADGQFFEAELRTMVEDPPADFHPEAMDLYAQLCRLYEADLHLK